MSSENISCLDRLKYIRNMVCCVLSAEVRQRHEPLYCLDAFDKHGTLGVNWKNTLKDHVHVTVANREIDCHCLCEERGLTYQTMPLDFSRVPGDPMVPQQSTQIFTARCAAHVLLHMESFDFIYLNPTQNLSSIVDSAVTNLRNNGILCVTSSDISSKFTRSAFIVKRHYGANVIKTSYMKELALRIVLANIARSCGKCNKGIEVLLSLCEQDLYLIVIRVVRGSKEADSSLEKIVPVLHCQICEERVLYPNTLLPQEEPYSLLPCSCYKENPGKTAVILGPVWSGDLFNIPFIKTMDQVNDDHNLGLSGSLATIKEEAECTCDSLDKEPELKRTRLSAPEKPMPVFYYNIPSMKLRAVQQPKFSRLLEYLRQDGYRSSRTHLDRYGIRTNATLRQLSDLLYKYCTKKS